MPDGGRPSEPRSQTPRLRERPRAPSERRSDWGLQVGCRCIDSPHAAAAFCDKKERNSYRTICNAMHVCQSSQPSPAVAQRDGRERARFFKAAAAVAAAPLDSARRLSAS